MIPEASEHGWPLKDQRQPQAVRITVRIIAEGRHMIVYQAQSRPATRIRSGTTVELYSSTGRYTGISRRVGAIRVPEPPSLDLVLRRENAEEPTIILNVSTRLDWVVAPVWAKIVAALSRRTSTIVYPTPILAPAPPGSANDRGVTKRHASTLDITGSDEDEQ